MWVLRVAAARAGLQDGRDRGVRLLGLATADQGAETNPLDLARRPQIKLVLPYLEKNIKNLLKGKKTTELHVQQTIT